MGSYEAASPQLGEIPDDGRSQVANEETRRLSRQQIFILIATASLNFSSMVCYSILGPFFPREAERKGVSTTIVGLIFGCFALFNFLTSLIMGKYLVQIGAKFMFVTGMLVSGCVTILFGFLDKAPDGPVFIGLCFLVRSMDAIGFSTAMTASFSILVNTFPQNVATVMGTLEIFTGLGLVMGPPIGGFLYQTFGYEIPFIALGSVMLLMVPLNMFILPNYDSAPKKDSFLKLIVLPKVLILCLNIFGISASLAFLDPTMSLFVLEKFQLPAGYVGLVFLGLALSYSLSSPFLGFLSDKIPCLRKWLLIFGGLLTALGYFFLGPAPFLHIESQLWLFILMLVLVGFALAMIGIPIFPEMLSSAYENGFEEGLTLLGLVSGLFNAIWALGWNSCRNQELTQRKRFRVISNWKLWSVALPTNQSLKLWFGAVYYFCFVGEQHTNSLYRSFLGPTLGGFLNEKLGFEWSAAIQGGFPLLSGLASAIFYIYEAVQRRRSHHGNLLGSEQERTLLLNAT